MVYSPEGTNKRLSTTPPRRVFETNLTVGRLRIRRKASSAVMATLLVVAIAVAPSTTYVWSTNLAGALMGTGGVDWAKKKISQTTSTYTSVTVTNTYPGNTTSKTSLMLAGIAVGPGFDESKAKLVTQARIAWIRTDVQLSSDFHNAYSVASRNRINIVGILDYDTLNWNSSFTLQDWKSAVAKAQSAYPLIHVWEIWNEPTLPKYRLGYMDGSPQHYVDLLRSAYETLKAGDAQATVIGLGGVLLGRPGDLDFAKAVFADGGNAVMDAYSVHAYPGDLNIGKNWEYYNQLWTQELQQYKAFGKPLWVTETGLESTQLTEADQSEFLTKSYSFFVQQGASAFIWFQLKDYYGSDGTFVACGLVRVDMTTKPSYVTYRNCIK